MLRHPNGPYLLWKHGKNGVSINALPRGGLGSRFGRKPAREAGNP
jgi:hypothetical protein